MAKKGLGKGLSSILDVSEDDLKPKKKEILKETDENYNDGIKYIKLSLIEPNKKQPRKHFDEEKIDTLSASIKENGLIQPIIVTKSENGMYKIIAGERRWRASKKAKLKEIPVLIREYSDEQAAEIALIENLQREDLNPIEEALGYNLLMSEFSLTQDAVSKKIGKSRSAIANSLRLLSLDDEIKNLLIEGKLSSGHARAILSVEDNDLRHAMSKRIIDDELNVRQSEALAKQITKKAPNKKTISPEISAAFDDLSNKLSSGFGTKVKVSGNEKKGKIEIEYFGNDDLDRILNMFNIKEV